jgi:mannose-6-phosphate isomerase-like protein (cupin superfamily)
MPWKLVACADRWLYVVDGSGVAIINGHKIRLKTGMMVLIEAGDCHEIRNSRGHTLLKTVSVSPSCLPGQEQ